MKRLVVMKTVLVSVALMAGVASFADVPAASEPVSYLPFSRNKVESLPGQHNEATNAALDRVLVNVSPETPLQKAIADIAEATKILVVVDWEAIEELGPARRVPVDVLLNQVSARKALHTILARHGMAFNLAMVVDDDRLVIAPLDNLRTRYQDIHTYDVGPLVADFEPASEDMRAVEADVTETLTNAVEPGSWRDNGGTVGSIRFSGNTLIINQAFDVMPSVDELVGNLVKHPQKVTASYDVRDLLKDAPPADPHTTGKADELINAIEATCGRDTWRGKGGKTSSIAAFDGKLYVTTTPAVHEQIEALLAMMRKKD